MDPVKRIRLYIADMDARFVAGVRGAMNRVSGMEVVGSADSGRRALDDILRLKPDVLLTDIPLPELDGIALLREVRRLRRPPAVIVCTRFYSDASLHCACKYGASFFLCKPVELDSLPRLIGECDRIAGESALPDAERRDAPSGDDPAPAVRALLSELGIPARLSGSVCLIEAIRLLKQSPLLIKNLSQGLYAQIALRLDATVPRVERAIRCAVGVAYQRGGLSGRFPAKPSNRAFIEYLLRSLDGRTDNL